MSQQQDMVGLCYFCASLPLFSSSPQPPQSPSPWWVSLLNLRHTTQSPPDSSHHQPWTPHERYMVYVGTEGSRRMFASLPSWMKWGKNHPVPPMGFAKAPREHSLGPAPWSDLSRPWCAGTLLFLECAREDMKEDVTQDNKFVSWHPALIRGGK